MIGDVINEIDALKEVNQFVWMTIGIYMMLHMSLNFQLV